MLLLVAAYFWGHHQGKADAVDSVAEHRSKVVIDSLNRVISAFDKRLEIDDHLLRAYSSKIYQDSIRQVNDEKQTAAIHAYYKKKYPPANAPDSVLDRIIRAGIDKRRQTGHR